MVADQAKNAMELIYSLNERAKELNCLYRIDEALKNIRSDLEDVFYRILKAIPPGWQYPDVCEAKIYYEDTVYKTSEFNETGWVQTSGIYIGDEKVGEIKVFYTQPVRLVEGSVFLKEEQKLLDAIALRLGNFIFHKQLDESYDKLEKAETALNSLKEKDSKLLDILLNSDLEEIHKYLESPSKEISSPQELEAILEARSNKHWKWRSEMADKIIKAMGTKEEALKKFGVERVYIFGSVSSGKSGRGSDIDLLVHVIENNPKQEILEAWLDAWSKSLAEINYQKTGYETGELLDAHYITDVDISNKTSWAMKLESLDDRAKPLLFDKETR